MDVRQALAAREARTRPLSANHVRVVATLGTISAAVFVADASLVESGTTTSSDRTLELDVHERLSHAWHGVMSAFSFLGEGGAVFAFAIVAVMILVWLRFHKAAIVALVAPSLALALETVLKDVFRRARPHLWPSADISHSFSFPSGHATGSAAIAAALVWVVFRHGGRKAGMAALLLGTAFALGVGLSRVYLGLHWPSDIVAGYALAVFAVAVVVVATERLFPAI